MPVDGANAHSRLPGDALHRHVQAAHGEQPRRGSQDKLAVTARISPQGPAGQVGHVHLFRREAISFDKRNTFRLAGDKRNVFRLMFSQCSGAVEEGIDMADSSRATTPFTRESTAEDVMRDVSLHGRRVLITGGGSGIGAETARVLAAAGAEVTLAVRRIDAGERAAEQIRQSTGNPSVLTAHLDLADQASVRELADSWGGPLHALVNNAGVMALPTRTLTPDGWELQFATNHLGHFALALGLHDALAEAGGARIVSVSSDVRHDFPIVFDDI